MNHRTLRSCKKKHFGLYHKTWNSILSIIAIVVVSLTVYPNLSFNWKIPTFTHKPISPLQDGKNTDYNHHAAFAQEPVISPLQDVSTVAIITPRSTISETQQEIENYIRTIFGSDAQVAIAISHSECSPHNVTYPHCHAESNVEYSIGIFQINLTSRWAKVHYDRVPGNMLEDKVKWLEDPKNNTLMAYWIFKEDGFYPWSSFTSGSYRNNL